MRKATLWAVFALAASAFLQGCEPPPPQSKNGQLQSANVPQGEFVASDGQQILVQYLSTERAKLRVPDGPELLLEQAVSASGARFVADDWEWWEHQGEGTLRHGEAIVFQGQQQ